MRPMKSANSTHAARVLTATPIALPEHASDAQGIPADRHFHAIGNAALLTESLLGLLSSRECPGNVLLETLDRIPEWVRTGRVIVSGFHSPLEQQVLRSVLRRKGRVVKVLARGMSAYRPRPEEWEPLTEGRMLLLSACPPETRRTTRQTSLLRNRLVLALANEMVIPFAADGSPLATLLAECSRTSTARCTSEQPLDSTVENHRSNNK